jgi:hypothetical protein
MRRPFTGLGSSEGIQLAQMVGAGEGRRRGSYCGMGYEPLHDIRRRLLDIMDQVM